MTEPTDNLVYNFVYSDLVLNYPQRLRIAEFLEKLAGHPVEAHRVKRGNDGGKYVLKNIMWISPEKHKELHQGEIMGLRG
jgi:hypothetical protein